MNDQRVWFFLVAALACALLVPVSPSDLRWVAEVTGAVYVVLAALVTLDLLGRRRR